MTEGTTLAFLIVHYPLQECSRLRYISSSGCTLSKQLFVVTQTQNEFGERTSQAIFDYAKQNVEIFVEEIT